MNKYNLSEQELLKNLYEDQQKLRDLIAKIEHNYAALKISQQNFSPSSDFDDELMDDALYHWPLPKTEKQLIDSGETCKFCRFCGTIAPMNAKYCMACGTPFAKDK